MDREYFINGEHDAITDLLMGRTVVKVDDHTLLLDNGLQLKLPDTDGGCACSAGCYDLTELNGVDNVITKVEFNDDPAGDDEQGEGLYQIFVFAGDSRVNLATWEGSDGNGYYGTGYSIFIERPADWRTRVAEEPEAHAVAAYTGYMHYTGGLTFDGRAMPPWVALTEPIQNAWRAAALAVYTIAETDLY
jgi:hypothetical protein